MSTPHATLHASTAAPPRVAVRALFGAGLFMVIAIWIAYIPALRGGYVWDDDTFLWNNPHVIAHDSPAHFWKLWGPDRPPDYFPLTSTTLWVEWHWLWGDNPAGFHAVNVALHTISALLLWAVLRRLGMGVWWAWAGAMLFALHPVNVESVAWITERKNALPLPLLLASLLCWLRGESVRERMAALNNHGNAWRWYAAALVLFVLSLLGKTAGVPLPGVMLAIVWWRRGRVTWRDAARMVPFGVVALVLAGITIWYQRDFAIGGDVVRDDTMLSRIAIAARAVWFYLGKIVWPTHLSFVYPLWPAAAVERFITWLPLAALAGLSAALWLLRQRAWARTSLLALAVYLAMLLPVLGLVNIYFMRYSLVANHWQYFAIAAPLALFVAGAAMLVRRRPALGSAMSAALAIVLSFYGVATWREASKYRDIETLWHATLAVNPDAWLPHNNLGSVLLLSGRAEASIPHFERAIAIDPTQTESLSNLGAAYHAVGDRERALHHYQAALRLAPSNISILSNIGSSYIEAGDHAAALPYMLRAAQLVPERASVHYNLGVVLLGLSRWEEAEQRFRWSIRLEPSSAMAHNNLGAALVRLGDLAEAVRAFEEALRINPSHAEARRNIEAIEQALRQRRED